MGVVLSSEPVSGACNRTAACMGAWRAKSSVQWEKDDVSKSAQSYASEASCPSLAIQDMNTVKGRCI